MILVNTGGGSAPKETGTAYDVHADIPGVKREDIKVTVDGDVVTISAEASKEEEKKESSRNRVGDFGAF